MNAVRISGLAFLVLMLQACAVLGTPTPETFEERLAAGYASVAGVRDTATALLVSGRITVEDARNVQAQADAARAGLDIALQVYATAPDTGLDRLETSITILTALEAYLRSRQ